MRDSLKEKEVELLEKQRELAEKDQTMIVMKEQLGLEKKLRGILIEEKENAIKEAKLAAGLCSQGGDDALTPTAAGTGRRDLGGKEDTAKYTGRSGGQRKTTNDTNSLSWTPRFVCCGRTCTTSAVPRDLSRLSTVACSPSSPVLHCLGARTPLPVVLHPLQARFSKVGVNELMSSRDGRGKKTIAITAVGGTGVSEVC